MVRTDLSVPGIVVTGLCGTLGAGLFAGLAPASAAAGGYLLVGVVVAGLLALCSAFSTADQSRAYPGPGAGYRYAARQLGRWPGRMAGSASIAGRAAAAAAVAGTFGAYVTPDRPLLGALGVLAVAVALEVTGVKLSTRLSWIAVLVVLVVLALVVATCFAVPAPEVVNAPDADDPRGLLPAAGTMLFAYLGFERITAPDLDEPSHSARRLHVAIPVLLLVVLACYLTVGGALLRQLGPTRLALSRVPLREAVVAADGAWLGPLVVAGAAVAAVTSLLLVLSSLRRTVSAVAADGDLPGPLRSARVSGWVCGALVAVLVLLVGTPDAIGFAACAMLAYYAFTNAAARILLKEDRTWPMRSACFGLGLSVLLGMTMAPTYLGVTVLAVLLGAGALGLYRRVA
ncbi:hypothetical protein GCM10010174_58300 [Kutzneria viridogrisea]|uniref:APA family basic amino acid/polyamine antiporter n=1 Tax=Kutzneria viridogrisea TaxID=47990 RepID=A0ABR6BKA2_9PSEU|nr:APA family basic amino acid/polyamine antiporter [Kutzneria viridogrisea]